MSQTESACTCSLCVCSVFWPLCVIRRVWLSAAEPLWDVGPCSLKGWTMPVLLWAFLCNKITQKRHFQEFQRQIKTLLSVYTVWLPEHFWSLLFFMVWAKHPTSDYWKCNATASNSFANMCFHFVARLGKSLSCVLISIVALDLTCWYHHWDNRDQTWSCFSCISHSSWRVHMQKPVCPYSFPCIMFLFFLANIN